MFYELIRRASAVGGAIGDIPSVVAAGRGSGGGGGGGKRGRGGGKTRGVSTRAGFVRDKESIGQTIVAIRQLLLPANIPWFAEVFSVPLAHVLDEKNYIVESRSWRGTRRHYYTVPFGPHYIWGATARMLRNLAGVMQ